MVCTYYVLVMRLRFVTVGVTQQITVKRFAHTMVPGPSDAMNLVINQ